MIKIKDYERVQKLIIVRESTEKAWQELNLLLGVLGKEELIDCMKKLNKIHNEAVEDLDKLIDWSEEE